MKRAPYSFFSRQDSHFQYDLFLMRNFTLSTYCLNNQQGQLKGGHLLKLKTRLSNTWYWTFTKHSLKVTAIIMRKLQNQYTVSGWLLLNWLILRSIKVELSPSLVTLGPLGCLRPSCLVSFELLCKAMSNEEIGTSSTPTWRHGPALLRWQSLGQELLLSR